MDDSRPRASADDPTEPEAEVLASLQALGTDGTPPGEGSLAPLLDERATEELLIPGSVEWAETVAFAALEPLGDPWNHTMGLFDQARIAQILVPPADRPRLLAAALVHDIGRAPVLARTGFAPLDAALWLIDRGLDELAGLVAHQCGSRFEAALRGLEVYDEIPEVSRAGGAILTWCELTTSDNGERVTPTARRAEIEAQGNSIATRALGLAWWELMASVEWVEEELGDQPR